MAKKGLIARAVEAGKHLIGIKELDLISAQARPEDQGFRRLSAKSDKELSPLDWKRQMAIAHYLWLTNPIARRIVELFTDFVVGDGFTISTKDETARQVLEKFWNDPDNAWDMKQFDRAQELSLFGVLLFKPFVNKQNGEVKLSPIDPAWISKIIPDPDKADQVAAIELSMPGKSPETLSVIRLDTDPMSATYNRLVGQVFYFAVNKLSYTLQGISDLFTIADWLDAYDNFLFHSMERIIFLNAHLYDITITGATPDMVKERAADLEANPPKPGGFRVHDEKEKWEALAPKINSAEIEQLSRIVKMLILGSAGIPEHWFAEGGNTNRATAEEMGTPILRKLKRRQATWRDIMDFILKFALDQAIIAKKIPVAEYDYEIVVPSISTQDVKEASASLVSLTDALVAAVAAKFTTQEDAAKLWNAQASELGVEVDAPTAGELAGQASADATAQDVTAAEDYAALAEKKKKKTAAQGY